jgi:hypothetical protein
MRSAWLSGTLLILSSVAGAQASLTGYVRDDETLRGLQEVELSVDGSDKRARTDKEGKYNLRDLAAGNVRIRIRFVGFAPIDTVLAVAAGKTTESVFFLRRQAVALDTTITTSGRVAGAGFESFELRRAKGFGRFIDSVYLRAHENTALSNLITGLGSVDVMKPGTCHGSSTLWCSWRVAVTKHARGDAPCIAEVVLDGQVVSRGFVIDNRDAPPFSSPAVMAAVEKQKEYGWSRAFDLNSLGVSALRGVEVYRSAADAQGLVVGDDAGCGVVVLWTRRG